MTQTIMARESGPDGTPRRQKASTAAENLDRRRRRARRGPRRWPVYAATIDRSLTKNLNRGVELPTDESSLRPPEGGAGNRHAELCAARLRQP